MEIICTVLTPPRNGGSLSFLILTPLFNVLSAFLRQQKLKNTYSGAAPLPTHSGNGPSTSFSSRFSYAVPQFGLLKSSMLY